jgi:hypothetical protein
MTVRRPFIVEARRLGRESEVPHAWLLRALSFLSGRFRGRMENLVVYGVMQPLNCHRCTRSVPYLSEPGVSGIEFAPASTTLQGDSV